jgi:hypothetical protein
METTDVSEHNRQKKWFEVAVATRQFEIDLFWKRALFFWGFIATAFVALGTLEGKSPTLSLLVSGFGMVCSLAWTLANQGSKYWQEQWESKIESAEDDITGPLFKREEPAQKKGPWLSGKPYSVSKLAIAVSDYVFLVWVVVFLRGAWIALGGLPLPNMQRAAAIGLGLLPIVYLGLIFGLGRSTPRPKQETPNADVSAGNQRG